MTTKRPPVRNAAIRLWLALLGIAIVAATAAVVVAVRAGDDGQANPPAGLAAIPGDDPGLLHVHGLGVDPADHTLYAATHYGIFRVPESGAAQRIANRYQDTMGFTVVGPGHFLGSGHPDGREDLPAMLGLIESTDRGLTWTAQSLLGEADFHALRAAHGSVYGWDRGQLMVSSDKVNWDRRARLMLTDFVVSPASPDVLLAATPSGLLRSSDGGRTFASVAGAASIRVLAWPAADTLYGVTPEGAVHASADGGTTWQQRGTVSGAPEAMTADGPQTLYVATGAGIVASRDGGKTFTVRYRSPEHS